MSADEGREGAGLIPPKPDSSELGSGDVSPAPLILVDTTELMGKEFLDNLAAAARFSELGIFNELYGSINALAGKSGSIDIDEYVENVSRIFQILIYNRANVLNQASLMLREINEGPGEDIKFDIKDNLTIDNVDLKGKWKSSLTTILEKMMKEGGGMSGYLQLNLNEQRIKGSYEGDFIYVPYHENDEDVQKVYIKNVNTLRDLGKDYLPANVNDILNDMKGKEGKEWLKQIWSFSSFICLQSPLPKGSGLNDQICFNHSLPSLPFISFKMSLTLAGR